MFEIRGICRGYAALLRLLCTFEHMGRRVAIHPSCDIRRGAAPYIWLGDGVLLMRDVWINVPVEAPPAQPGKPIIRIGPGTAIGRRCMISGLNSIVIGPNVVLAPGVFVTDHSHEFSDPDVPISRQGVSEPGSVTIEEGCWLGHNSAVVTHRGRHITLGRNSVVGANAVVTKSCDPNSVMVGSPSRNVAAQRHVFSPQGPVGREAKGQM
jgi:acetyltransferase-like isoleucine patch superfamily enzyme